MFFSFCALFGPLPIFQTNQLVQALREIVAVPNGWVAADGQLAFQPHLRLGAFDDGLREW